MRAYKLPQNIQLGSATASLQIEGGDRNNSWYQFCENNRIKDGSHCIVAADHWNRYEEDIAIMKQLNQETYRMSIEWSRIEPAEGQYNQAALDHYRDEILKLLDAGIRPLVTLHHFSNPIWIEEAGAWTNPRIVNYFSKYVKTVVYALGDLVCDWVTINEPNVYLFQSYIELTSPPAKPSMKHYFKGIKLMIEAHIDAYRAIHRIRSEQHFLGQTQVGVAFHMRVFDIERKKIRSALSRKLTDYVFHTLFLEGMIHGNYKFPIHRNKQYINQRTELYCDFFGLNYYSRDIIEFTWNPFVAFAKQLVKKGIDTNDMGWEIYPEGLYRICKEIYKKYQLPIYITENGICDQTDGKRAKFIYDHLEQVAKLCEEGIPIERYYHWSTIDNFEWQEGLSRRFGLVHINYETQARTIKQSGYFYAEICKTKEVSPEMLMKYQPS
ncbi:glycoside hydrolase family 1 protein [Paenibacillus albiflavus]|uniref:Glycoside hydrolase family 1 protein n=1 Tax=Paenibacillus albiflavus TaxID=2545760 RepID=A0A4R4EG63_9BACL|nr:glycoside hydrolase family 1 protein [Paenibacillus albiflavus]TCZ77108.1 glycoside hydrolase family 1 protein [Paenibacillus albiflavus]